MLAARASALATTGRVEQTGRGLYMGGCVKIRILLNIEHGTYYSGYPKRDPNFDNHSYVVF